MVRTIRKEDDSRPVIDAASHPLTTNHLYFGWYYGKFRDLERAVTLFYSLSRLPTEYGAQALPDPASLDEIWPARTRPDWAGLSLNYRLQVGRLARYVPWRGDRRSFVRESQAYQAQVLKHATKLFGRRKYRPTGGTFAFMLNDPAPAISWSVADRGRRPKAAYSVLMPAMNPLLICAEYPRASYVRGRPNLLLAPVRRQRFFAGSGCGDPGLGTAARGPERGPGRRRGRGPEGLGGGDR